MKRQIIWALAAVVVGTTLPLVSLAEDAYLESNGSAGAGINSRYFFNPKSRIEVDFALTDASTAQARVWGMDATSPMASLYVQGNLNVAFGSGDTFVNSDTQTGLPADTSRHTAILDVVNREAVYMTGTTTSWSKSSILTTHTPSTTATVPLSIFAGTGNNKAGTTYNNYAKMRLYRIKFFTDGVLVHDYLPCVKGGVPGLRDQVDGVFVTGENIGAFSVGGDVETIEDDPWIALSDNNQTNGWQFVDTGYRPTPNTRFEIDYAFYRNYGDVLKDNGDWVVFSGYSSVSNNALTQNYSVFNFYCNKNGTAWSCGGDNWIGAISGFPKPVDDKDIRRRVVLDAKNKTLVLTTAGFTNYTGTCTGYRDFNYRTVKIGAWYHGLHGFAPLKIYGCRIFEDDVLVRDLRPCVQDGLAGLKDEVDGSFLACGTRTYGGPIPHEQGDGYIESTARNYSIDTGYTANSNTCIWVDWALTSRDNSSSSGGQQFVYETPGLVSRIYGNGTDKADTHYSWTFSRPAKWTDTGIVIVTNVRHQAYIDSYGDRVVFMNGSYTTYSTTMSAQHMTNHAAGASGTVRLFSNASANGNFALMRLYGFKIWDAGTLVRDYIPYFKDGAAGLYDRVNGTFVTAGRHALTYGGNIAGDGGAMDAYIESDGTQGIDTEYLMRGSESRIEADFAFTDTDKVGTSNNYQQRVFGQDSGGGMLTAFYITGSGTFNFGFGNTFINNHGPQVTADVRRHKTVIDGYHDRLHYITGSVTNNSYDISGDAHSNVATWPMGIFATPNNQAATTWRNPAKMKLFSFRIYERDELKHEYLPYKKGDIVGLYDTVTKTVKTDARGGSAFKIGGKGVDGAERWIVTPQRARLSKSVAATTLSANAAGAVSYRWTLNDAAIASGEDGDLTVEWEKAKAGTVETYAVVPIYDVCGEPSEGAPVSVTVEHLSAGTLLLVR